jgi:hypothetical protein
LHLRDAPLEQCDRADHLHVVVSHLQRTPPRFSDQCVGFGQQGHELFAGHRAVPQRQAPFLEPRVGLVQHRVFEVVDLGKEFFPAPHPQGKPAPPHAVERLLRLDAVGRPRRRCGGRVGLGVGRGERIRTLELVFGPLSVVRTRQDQFPFHRWVLRGGRCGIRFLEIPTGRGASGGGTIGRSRHAAIFWSECDGICFSLPDVRSDGAAKKRETRLGMGGLGNFCLP